MSTDKARFLLDSILSDIRYGLRSLRRAPGLTATVLAILCLSIGGFAVVFSGIDAALVRPLPGVVEPHRLVWLTTVFRSGRQPQGLSYREFVEFEEQTGKILTSVAAYDARPVSLASGGEPVRLRGHFVTGDYFGVLGAHPLVGRIFDRDEFSPAVIVLGYSLWRDRFGSDPGIVGRTLLVNGGSAQVVGVAPPNFRGPELGAEADLWLTLGRPQSEIAGDDTSLWKRNLRAMARLAPGVSRESAERALAGVSRGIAQATGRDELEDESFRLVPVAGGVAPDVRQDSQLMAGLFVAVGLLVLFIACLNIANLLLVRTINRAHEISMRLALGCSHSRLARLFLIENALLALGGGLSGMLLAVAVGRIVEAAYPPVRGLAMGVQPRMLAFSLVVACSTGVLFGVLPALHAARWRMASAPGRATRTASGSRGLRIVQNAFIVGQLGASLTVLVAAGQFYMAIRTANQADLGFNAKGITEFSYDLVLQNYNKERRLGFENETLERLAGVRGVASVALADLAPLSGVMIFDEATADGQLGRVSGTVATLAVSPSYFLTLGIPLLAGRPFAPDDREGRPLVAVVNETAVHRFWGRQPAIGKTLIFDGGDNALEVVGVVADAKYDEPLEEPAAVVYVPRAQRMLLDRTTVLVRGSGGVAVRGDVLKSIVRELDPALPVFEMKTLATAVHGRMNRQETAGRLLTIFGILGLTIAGIGLFGITSYAVAQRSREFGVRLTLGAAPGQLVRSVLYRGLWLAIVGVIGGAAVSLPIAMLLSRSVFGVNALSISTFIWAALLLTAISLIASGVPARRAARTDPVVTLRAE